MRVGLAFKSIALVASLGQAIGESCSMPDQAHGADVTNLLQVSSVSATIETATAPAQPEPEPEHHVVPQTATDPPKVELSVQKIAPFGKEDTSGALQEHAARTQDTLVDAVENAEVAEIKRAVFRSLTRLRAAEIKEFDTIARLETQAIDEYNDAHHYRAENPLEHLHASEPAVQQDKFAAFHGATGATGLLQISSVTSSNNNIVAHPEPEPEHQAVPQTASVHPPSVELSVQKIAPFGKEDTSGALQEHAARTQDTLVDAVENAEVAEIKRAVFRSLTRLRAAEIKEFDTIARLETQAIDEYNDAHHYRAENPLDHLHSSEPAVQQDKFAAFH